MEIRRLNFHFAGKSRKFFLKLNNWHHTCVMLASHLTSQRQPNMTHYAIGSVKGNFRLLSKLLEQIHFDPENDCLWFSGNLVNGGDESLEVLRFVKGLGKKAVTVLGSEEFRLLAIANGFVEKTADDSVDDILNAEDKDALLKWIRQRALIHHDSKLNFTLVHSGVYPEWSFSKSLTFAYEVESVLSGSNYLAFLENRQQGQTRWHEKLRGWKRLHFICNAYTLMKYFTEQGKLDFQTRGAVEQTAHLIPWYRRPERVTANLNIVFSDDANFNDERVKGIYPLSSDGVLSAWKLSETPEYISVSEEQFSPAECAA